MQELVSTHRPGSCSLLSVSGELDLAFLGHGRVGFGVGGFFVVEWRILGTLHNFLLSLAFSLCF